MEDDKSYLVAEVTARGSSKVRAVSMDSVQGILLHRFSGPADA